MFGAHINQLMSTVAIQLQTIRKLSAILPTTHTEKKYKINIDKIKNYKIRK